MRDREERSTRTLNAFSEEFLLRFEDEDEPASAGEADGTGPWGVRPLATDDGREAFGIWRLGERPEWGDPPSAQFREQSTALLAAAVRPFLARDPFYQLGKERWNSGFPLLRHGEEAGWIDLFDEDWVFGVNVLERFTRSPEALATLLQAAGPVALERAGCILREKVMEMASRSTATS